MNSISGIGGNYGMTMQGMGGMKRPDPTQMADNLFSTLDTSGQGYLTKTDLQSALDNVSSSSTVSSSSASPSVDQLFSTLDTNSDNKVTKQEFSDALKKVADQLDSQFTSMRMNDGTQASGAGGDSGGLTKDQLTTLSNNIDSSDSAASSSIKILINN